MSDNNRLPVSFHNTFIPELRFISALMKLSDGTHDSMDIYEISSITGIPTGESSGKVEPHIRYSVAMQLIRSEKNNKKYILELSDIGKLIFLEDPYLSEDLSLWWLHLNLCNKYSGAETWYQTFIGSTRVLGEEFNKNGLDAFLNSKMNSAINNVSGAMLRMYDELASFKSIRALEKKENNIIKRNSAPLNNSYIVLYAYLVLKEWEYLFPNRDQLTLEEFNLSQFFELLFWDKFKIHECLEMLSNKEFIRFDLSLGKPVLQKLRSSFDILSSIYENLL